MMKSAFASAAVLGAVMVAPAQATVPAETAPAYYSFDLFTQLADYLNLLDSWKSAWQPYFPSASASGTLFGVTYTSFVSGFDTRTFTSQAIGGTIGGSYTMPVPGPIAGAGLPLLAAGIAFAAWRRRRAANAA